MSKQGLKSGAVSGTNRSARRCEIRDSVVPADRKAVRTIVERTDFFRADEVEVAVELIDEHLARGTASGYHFVFAVCEEEVVGYACFGPIACTVGSFDLYWVAVDPQFQGQGIGGMLLTAVETRVARAGGQRIYSDTSGRAQYAPTRVFYEHHGFWCDAQLKDFYAVGDDRLIYSKFIANLGFRI